MPYSGRAGKSGRHSDLLKKASKSSPQPLSRSYDRTASSSVQLLKHSVLSFRINELLYHKSRRPDRFCSFCNGIEHDWSVACRSYQSARDKIEGVHTCGSSCPELANGFLPPLCQTNHASCL